MHNLTIYNKQFQIPSKWNELSKNQLIKVAELYSKKLTKEATDILFISYLTGIKVENLKQISTDLAEISTTFSFIHKKITITKNHFPELKFKKTIVSGPEDGLLDVTFEQFVIYSEPSFLEYTKTESIEALNYFIATLYTFKKSEFDETKINNIIRLVSKISYLEKIAIFLFYCGSRNFLMQRYPELFSESKTDSKQNADPLAFINTLDILNDKDVSKNQEIKKSKVYEVFKRLNEIVKESNKQKTQNINR